jgi:hypothetical protein
MAAGWWFRWTPGRVKNVVSQEEKYQKFMEP